MGSIVSRSVRVPSSPPPAMRVLDGIQEEEKTAAAPPRAKIIPLPLNNNHVSSPFLRTDQEQEDAKGTHPPMVVAQVDVRNEERRLSGGGNRGASNPVISASGRSDSGGDRNIGDASIDGPETSTTKNHIPLELFLMSPLLRRGSDTTTGELARSLLSSSEDPLLESFPLPQLSETAPYRSETDTTDCRGNSAASPLRPP